MTTNTNAKNQCPSDLLKRIKAKSPFASVEEADAYFSAKNPSPYDELEPSIHISHEEHCRLIAEKKL